MQEQQIEEIKNALREMVQLIIARGQPLSEEIKVSLAQAMEHAASRIQQLRKEQTEQEKLPSPPPIDEAEEEQKIIADTVPITPEEPQGGHFEPIPGLEPAPYESSNINAFKYDPKSQKLVVKFQGKYPSQNGPVYAYEGVPKNIFEVFARGAVAPKTSGHNRWHRWKKGVTPSHGAAMYALIREGNFPFRKLR